MNMKEIVMRLLLEQPFYGYVASSVTFTESDSIAAIKSASIPSLKILYNPEWFNTLPNDHKMGAVIHELLHIILLHPFRRMNREAILWSVACDMAANELIFGRWLPAEAVTVSEIEKRIKRTMERKRNAEYYYDILSDTDDMKGFIGIQGDSILISEGGRELIAQTVPDEAVSGMEITALKQNLAQAVEQAGMGGELPAELEDSLDDVYRELRVNWRIILKRFLSGRGKLLTRKSYKRQSRRYDNLPGTKRTVGVNALLAIDESGSISDALVKEFYKELKEINKITGVCIQVTRFDTECTPPVGLNKFVIESKREKRGGTNFKPVFKLADDLKIPLVIIFTDGDGEAPDSVNQSTLWVLSKNGKKPAGYGAFVTFER